LIGIVDAITHRFSPDHAGGCLPVDENSAHHRTAWYDLAMAVMEKSTKGSATMSNDLFEDLKNTLSRGDEETFERVYQEVLPRVIQAARRRFGEGIRWYAPEDAASSAVRTVYRRLREGQLGDMNTWNDFEDLLVTVAYRKYVDKIRRDSVESRARERIARDSLAVAESQSEAMDALRLLDELPQDDVERVVLRGKLNGDNEETIARGLAEQTGEPWSKYMVRRIWEKLRAQFLQRASIRFG
jgi:DNA-directed RNA polymerase specialized sigma24 family protein